MATVMNYSRGGMRSPDRKIIMKRDIMAAVASNIYAMAPLNQPRKADTIMKKLSVILDDNFLSDTDFIYASRPFTDRELHSFLNDVLNSIPEFRELNLSQLEYDAGIGVDDPNRGKFRFTDGTPETLDSIKDDFIDLDALIDGVVFKLMKDYLWEKDCFFCDFDSNEKNAPECQNCIRSVNLTDNFQNTKHPKGRYHTVCDGTCDFGYYTCCVECKRAKDGSCKAVCSKVNDVTVTTLNEDCELGHYYEKSEDPNW